MFRPTYRYSAKLVENLLRIENARSAIDVLPLPKQAAGDLRQQARELCIQAASALAPGFAATYDTTLSLAVPIKSGTNGSGSDGVHAQPPDQSALQDIASVLLGSPSYRSSDAFVYDPAGKEVVYVPPESSDVPALMTDLERWIKDAWDRVPGPVLAGICQQQLVMIRPFEQGNEVAGRIAADMILLRKGYGLAGYAWPEVELAADVCGYQKAMNSTHSGVYASQADFTAFLELFTHAVAAAADKARNTVISRTAADRLQELGPAAPSVLKDRQRQALEFIQLNGAIRSGQYQELVQVVPDTARRDFVDLLDKGLIEVRGVGRGTYYVLTSRGSAEVQRRVQPATNGERPKSQRRARVT